MILPLASGTRPLAYGNNLSEDFHCLSTVRDQPYGQGRAWRPDIRRLWLSWAIEHNYLRCPFLGSYTQDSDRGDTHHRPDSLANGILVLQITAIGNHVAQVYLISVITRAFKISRLQVLKITKYVRLQSNMNPSYDKTTLWT